MEIVMHIATAASKIFYEAAPYMLFGLLLAGILRVYLQPDTVVHYLRRGRFRSVLYASLIGIPLPL